MKLSISLLASVLGLALPLAAAHADQTPAKPAQCFQIQNFENWKAADAKTVYVRVNLHRYYRLDMASSCPALLWPSAFLITKWHGGTSVCSALDWDIKVGENGSGVQSACIVKTMTPLTAEEAAAIPKGAKP